MFLYLMITKLIHLIYQAIQEFTVVGYHYHRSIESFDRLFQHILRTHIQVVGRLIQHKEVDRFQQQSYHRQTGSFTTRQHLHLLVGGLTSKHERTQYITNLRTNITYRNRINRIKHRLILIQQRSLILSEIANLHKMSQLQHTLILHLIHDTLHQSGLSFSILTNKGNLLSSFNRKINRVQHHIITIAFSQVLSLNRNTTRMRSRWKFQM